VESYTLACVFRLGYLPAWLLLLVGFSGCRGRLHTQEQQGRSGAPLTAVTLTPALTSAAQAVVQAEPILNQAANSCAPLQLPTGGESVTRFAVIGDYGSQGPAERAVASWVAAQQPAFVVTTGDNNYPNGAEATIDQNIGQYYAPFICPYRGRFGKGSEANRFFPSLGNHDWVTPGAAPYLKYFTLPNNERYYDVRLGNVHLFVVDSDEREPDGIAANSVQALWFAERIKASDAPFKVAVFHHPPYSTGSHGSSEEMRWPFAAWGIDLVLTGHDHHYERIERDGVTYIVNGLGGRSLYPVAHADAPEHRAFNAHYGGEIIEVTSTRLNSRFYAVDGTLVDEFTIQQRKSRNRPRPVPGALSPGTSQQK
jgi:tartrate-resistant acid phosphatase type 5